MLGKNLLFLRKLKGWQQSEIQAKLDIKASTWGNYETGISQPNLNVLIYISKYFGISETDLLHKDLSTDAHLIEKLKGEKNHENAHLNAHPNAHPSNKKEGFKERKYLAQTEFNQVLNDSEALYSVHQKIEDLYSKIADLAQKVSTIEGNIDSQASAGPKK